MSGNISTKPNLLGVTMFGEKMYTADQVDELIRHIALVMDDMPTIGSDNPVKSNGIAVRINDVVDELNERIDQSVSGLFRYCGSVRSYDDLPWPDPEDSAETLQKGDTYNVVEGYEDSNEEIPPGTNWAWNGVKWDPLAGSLADYLSKRAASETYATKTELSSHTGDRGNPHQVTKDQVGLGNVDNTSDADKPVSTATRTELDKKLDSSAAAETYATKTELSSHTGNTDNPHGVTKGQVGLGNVDNTPDADKPVSTATQAALDGKADKVNGATAGNFAALDASGNLVDSGKAAGDFEVEVDSAPSSTSANPVQNKALFPETRVVDLSGLYVDDSGNPAGIPSGAVDDAQYLEGDLIVRISHDVAKPLCLVFPVSPPSLEAHMNIPVLYDLYLFAPDRLSDQAVLDANVSLVPVEGLERFSNVAPPTVFMGFDNLVHDQAVVEYMDACVRVNSETFSAAAGVIAFGYRAEMVEVDPGSRADVAIRRFPLCAGSVRLAADVAVANTGLWDVTDPYA